MLFAGFSVTDSNVTVLARWMRQENGADDWFNRNNPLNNGWGSGGGGGLGSYDNLALAAENAADALHSVGGYSAIVDAFAPLVPSDADQSADRTALTLQGYRRLAPIDLGWRDQAVAVRSPVDSPTVIVHEHVMVPTQ